MIRWSVSRPAVIWATCASILIAGAVSFTRLALATKTEVELPRLDISASWLGASAELVETYVTSPIEALVQGVRGVRRTQSTSTEGLSSVTVHLDPKTDVQLARLAILERLELLRAELPAGVSRPTVQNYVPRELQEEPLLRLTLAGPYTAGTLQKLIDERLEPAISAVPGVAGVLRMGGTDVTVTVSYDAQLLRQLGIAPAALSQAIDEARVARALGRERRGAMQLEVAARDQPEAVEQLELLPVRGRGGRVFRLGQLASVRAEEDAGGRFFRINGEPALSLTVERLPSADAIKTARAVRTALETLQPTLPPGVSIRVVSDNSESLKQQLAELTKRGSIAFAAVVLVVALLLRNTKAVGLVMGSAAVSIAGTAFGLYVLRVPANLLTLAGLAMGIGILVQNPLVVVERLGNFPDTPQGRARAAEEIAPAVLGATLTTGVVLFPFLYLQGDARAAFVPFATAFLLALTWSVITAVVMVPALASGHRIHEATWPRMRRLYARSVWTLLRWRGATLLVTALGLAALGWVFVKKVPRFAWGSYWFGQRTEVLVFLQFPRGSDPETLDASMRDLERLVVGRRGVERVLTQGGGGSARMQVTFTREHELSAIPIQVKEELTQRAVFIGGAAVSVLGQGPGFSSGSSGGSLASFRVRVMGYSYSGVERLALDLKERLEQIPRVRNVNINQASFFSEEKSFAILIEPDRPALAQYGLTARDLAAAIAREVRGSVGRVLLEIGDEEYAVVVKAAGARDRSLEQLREALIPLPGGGSVPIRAVSRVEEKETLSTIQREDQQYIRTVAYEFRGPQRLADRTHQAFMKSTRTAPGYQVQDAAFGFREPDDSARGLWLVFAIGVVLVLLAIALVFDSLWATTMVSLILPVALGGVVLAFWIMKAAFTREAAVGVILVVGLAVNQAILVVDAALSRRRSKVAQGVRPDLSPREVLAAAVDRAGMVVLVTLAAMASLLPLAIGTSADTLFGAIALATLGGTVFGTLGAMLLAPALLLGPRRKTALRRRASPT